MTVKDPLMAHHHFWIILWMANPTSPSRAVEMSNSTSSRDGDGYLHQKEYGWSIPLFQKRVIVTHTRRNMDGQLHFFRRWWWLPAPEEIWMANSVFWKSWKWPPTSWRMESQLHLLTRWWCPPPLSKKYSKYIMYPHIWKDMDDQLHIGLRWGWWWWIATSTSTSTWQEMKRAKSTSSKDGMATFARKALDGQLHFLKEWSWLHPPEKQHGEFHVLNRELLSKC